MLKEAKRLEVEASAAIEEDPATEEPIAEP
jgi:hypothetical protein